MPRVLWIAAVLVVVGCSTDPTFVSDGAGGATTSANVGGMPNGGASNASTGGGASGGSGQGGAAGSGGIGGPCDQLANLDVFCIAPSGTHVTLASLSYGPGFPQGLPAMGLGQPALGYIESAVPFTCVAAAGDYGVSTNNTGGGKICEVIFDYSVASTVTGTGTYTLTADAAATAGDYLFSFTASNGSTVLSPNFYMRVQ